MDFDRNGELFEAQKQLAMERALRCLGMRWHTVNELGNKLKKSGFEPEIVRLTLAECQRLGLLDDRQYASDYAAQLADRGCGSYRIRLNLRRKGIAPEETAETLAQLAKDEPERAIRAAEFKLRMLARDSDWRRKREKLCRFLAGRGFRPEAIRAVIAHFPELQGRSDDFDD